MLLCPARGKKPSSFYIGITTNFEGRFKDHKNGVGAKYTKSYPPESGVVIESNLTHSDALKREHHYKSLYSTEKLKIFTELKSPEPQL